MVHRIVDEYAAAGLWKEVKRGVGVLMLLLALKSFVQYWQVYLSAWIGQHVVYDVRVRLYNHLLKMHPRFMKGVPTGILVSRTISDVEALSGALGEGLIALVSDLFQILLVAVLMFLLNWKLALISLGMLPPAIWLTNLFNKRVGQAFKELREALSTLSAFVQERVSGMSLVQVFGKEEAEFERFQRHNTILFQNDRKSIKLHTLHCFLLSFVSAVGVSAAVAYSALGALQGTLEAGELIAFLMYIGLLYRPLHAITDRFNALQMGLVSAERINRLLLNGAEVDPGGQFRPKKVLGKVVFEQVSFAYVPGTPVLRDISFEVPAQTSIAIVGTTGAGKSTIVNLLGRFYDPDRGTVWLDDTPVKEYALSHLRQHVGFVSQDVLLLSTSIYQNITLGNPSITRAQVLRAARTLGIHAFIESLPQGYEHPLQEQGTSLSAGQRQLLALARVLVHDPSVLVLDEATSTMDGASQDLVRHATRAIMHRRTCIIIAHRLSTIQEVDEILVLEKGCIVERGTHTTLMQKKDGRYAGLQEASVD